LQFLHGCQPATGSASFTGGSDRQHFAAQEHPGRVGLEMLHSLFIPRSAGIG
jgi:hypothetical protein